MLSFSHFNNHFFYLLFENNLTYCINLYLPLLYNLFLVKSKRVLTYKYTYKQREVEGNVFNDKTTQGQQKIEVQKEGRKTKKYVSKLNGC